MEFMKRLRLAIVDERGDASITPMLVDRLRAALTTDNSARFVTLEGGPNAFCTGMDPGSLVAFEKDPVSSENRENLNRFGALLEAIERSRLPVIALIDGPVIGGGIGLAGAADLVIATPKATFSLPEAFLGLIPAMVYPLLARRVGVARARWLAIGAASLSVAEALRIGLVDQIAEDLEVAVAACARRLLRTDPRALAEIKLMVAEHHGVTESYRSDATARFGRLLETPETRSRLVRFAGGEAPWPEDAVQESDPEEES
jgi:enoyl-CoA hydratase/carnithine racemase